MATYVLVHRDPVTTEAARAACRLWNIDTGHDLMFTEPEAVAALLLKAAAA